MKPSSTHRKIRLVYLKSDVSDEGLLTELPGKLASMLRFDQFGLAEGPGANRMTLWFRAGEKRVFQLHLIRRSGRLLIEMTGGDARQLMWCMQICKQHFDDALGIGADDIQEIESPRQKRHERHGE